MTEKDILELEKEKKKNKEKNGKSILNTLAAAAAPSATTQSWAVLPGGQPPAPDSHPLLGCLTGPPDFFPPPSSEDPHRIHPK